MKPHGHIAKTVATLALTFCLAATLRAQVVGYWRFDEQAPGNPVNTNAGALLDQSGNAYHGTGLAGLTYVPGSPLYGGTAALNFTLSPDHVEVPDAAGAFNFSPSQSITIEALVRTYSIGQDGIGAIANKQGANPGEWWWRINSNGKQQFWIDDGQAERKNVSGTRVLSDGQWHHLAAVYDATAQQLRVYVDYVLDGSAAAVFSTSGTIGNAEDLWIGAFQNGSRQFDGDIDFVRVSAAALDPTNFVQTETYLTGFTPEDDASFLSAATAASFTVVSPTVGVAQSNIVVTVGGSDISGQLGFAGTDNNRTVMLPALAANTYYPVHITVTDNAGNRLARDWVFNTFANNLFFIEAEDYNFDSGQFIDNPQLSSVDGPDNYLDRIGVEGVDYHQTATPALAQYRIGDMVGTAVSLDVLRQNYLDAQVSDPGVTDYMVRDNVNGEWLNYTRTFPAGTYHVYLRFAKPGTVDAVMQLDEVTSGSTTSAQTLAPMGAFHHAPTTGNADYEFIPLTDATGQAVAVSLSGQRTLRLTLLSGAGNVNLNYFVFVPATETQPPFVAAVSPVFGAGNEASNVTVQATIRNADTTVATGTVQLLLDGASVAPTVNPTGIGADVSYAPAPLAIGQHTATLIYSDSAATAVTNTWPFFVANQAVRGYWKFNEQTPGHLASTNAGAILDASGNQRHGTVTSGAMAYVGGSFNYGNTPALQFTPDQDSVVIPDAQTGNFTFTNSFTFEAVVRSTNTTTTTGAILAKNGTGDGEGEFWWRFPGVSGGKQRVGLSGQILSGTNALDDGAWHHLAVVYDQTAGEVRLYADYALEASASATFTTAVGRPADLWIGSFIGGGSDFAGDIDSIRISDGALDPSQFIQTTVALQPIVKALLPASGARNVAPQPLISAEFQNRDTAVELSTLKLFVDGSDVTAGAAKATDGITAQISYTPPAPLADGPHTAMTIFNDTASPANTWTNSWSFTNRASIPVLAFYQFNEQAPGNLADGTAGAILDASGNGRNGTAVSLTGIPYVDGSPDYGSTPALEFTVANTNQIVVPDPTGAFNWSPTQSVTLEAIVRTTTIGQSSVGSLLAKQYQPTPEWWWRINATGKQQFNVNDGSASKSVSGTQVLNDGQWHHLAVIYDGEAKQMRAYVDHVQDGNTVTTTFSSTTSTIGNPQDLYIGRFQAGNRIFEGDIDAVRITAAALDTSWFIPLGGVVSPVQLLNVAAAGGNLSFGFVSELGRTYVIESTDALGGTWTDVDTIPGDGTLKSVAYPTTDPQRYFRVRVQ